MTPLGTYFSNEVQGIDNVLHYINALVIGIFLHISTTILFESSEGHKLDLSKLVAIIVAVFAAYLF